MPHWTDEYKQLIEDCENREHRLNDWERTFIDSIKNQLIAEQPLSPKQSDRLDEIWEKATARG